MGETLGIKYFETSALTGENVNEAVEALLEQVMEQMERCVDKTTLPPGSMMNGEKKNPKTPPKPPKKKKNRVSWTDRSTD